MGLIASASSESSPTGFWLGSVTISACCALANCTVFQ